MGQKWKTSFISAGIILIVIGLVILCIFLKNPSGVSVNKLKCQNPDTDYNVILVVISCLRADHLSCYGYHRKTSPAIDKLAKESFVFENAFSQAGYTLPSMMSIITSLYPASHGVMDVFKDKLSIRVRTIAEILRTHGYKTSWFSVLSLNPHLDVDIGFGRGYDYKENVWENLNGKEKIFSWVEKNKDSNFFIAMNLRKTHFPYFPKPQYRDKFLKAGKEEMVGGQRELDKKCYYFLVDLVNRSDRRIYEIFDKKDILSHNELFRGEYTEGKMEAIEGLIPAERYHHKFGVLGGLIYLEPYDLAKKADMEYLKSMYNACILETDQELIKPLISKLKELKIYDSTMLILTGDHGIQFAEHNLLGHHMHFYEGVIHVPLIIKLPRFRKKKVIKKGVQSVDIMPTILDLLGVDAPSYLQGKSLLPLLLNERVSNIPGNVFGQNNLKSYIRTPEWKLIISRPEKTLHPIGEVNELYCIRDDPRELYNVCYKYPDTYLKLKRKLTEFTESLPVYKDQEYDFLPHIDKENQERIKKTGYW